MHLHRKTAIATVAGAAVLGLVAISWDRADDSRSGTHFAPVADVASNIGADQEAGVAEEAPLRYDVDYPAIAYSTTPTSDSIAELRRRIDSGETALALNDERGYLDSLLRELDIDPASQLLVFSTTSLQVGSIRPRTPRAIYFNDDTYVAWVQGGGPIEVASMDPGLGPVFYTLEQTAQAELERQTGRCLRCHDSLSLTGGGVPRFILGSGYIDTLGNIAAHEGWIVTSQRTPLKNRFGGWYVTGQGAQTHLGNVVVKNVADLQHLDELRIGSLDTLDSVVDTDPYAAQTSDIAALMVIQHQVDVQNQISRVNFEVRSALYDAAARNAPVSDDASADLSGDDADVPADGPDVSADGEPALRALIAESVEPLVEAMLFVGEAPLTAAVSGAPEFAAAFEGRGPQDARGRSLRELDLTTRLMRYPFSYLVYSRAFESLPEPAKAQLYRRFAAVLSGEDRSERFAHLSEDDRRASLEILAATKPELAAALPVSLLAESSSE